MNEETALITGASSGIGLHLAREFAAHGHPLVLVAPVEAELQTIARELMDEHHVKVDVAAVDLEAPAAASKLFEALQRTNVAIRILVNNAGRGYRGSAWEIPIEHDLSMVRLNIEAALRLTKLFLPQMLKLGGGRIMNTASVAGFEPGPLLAVYHATKAFLLSWSEALAVELEDTPVTVTALCPGATDTDFFPKAGMVNTRIFQQGNVMSPQEVAKIGYKGMMEGKLFVVPGAMNKTLVAARRVLSESTQAKVNMKFYETCAVGEHGRHRGDIEGASHLEHAK